MEYNKNLIVVGKILLPHGLQGSVKIISYMQVPDKLFTIEGVFIDQFKPQQLVFLTHRLVEKNIFTCSIKDIATRTEAEKIIKQQLFIKKEVLPELVDDEFYIEDLKGMQVVDIDGRIIGMINAVYNFGANDIIEIKFNNGQVEMYDFNHKIFPSVNDRITFVPPKIL
jgi:16S rRNA processing protein RimM